MVVQSDLFNPTHVSFVICPITSHLVDAPLFRLTLRPSAENGLKMESQVIVDKVIALNRDRIGKRIGKVTAAELADVDRALSMWLGISVQR